MWKVENVIFLKNLLQVCVAFVEVLISQFLASNLHFWLQNSTKTLQNGQSRHPILVCLKIIIFSFLNAKNYSMSKTTYVPSFQISCEFDLRRKSYEPKTTLSRTREQKIGQVFLATTRNHQSEMLRKIL